VQYGDKVAKRTILFTVRFPAPVNRA